MSSIVAKPKAKVKEMPSQASIAERNRKASHRALKRSVIVGIIMAALAGLTAYCAFSYYYTTHFFPNTVINGVDAGNKEVFEVREQIASDIEQYQLTIITKEGTQETIDGKDIGLKAVFGNELINMLSEQKVMTWPAHIGAKEEKTIGTMVDYSSSQLKEAIKELPCMQDMVAPEDAHLSDYTEGTGYTVVPEVEGNTINFEELAYLAELKVPVLESTLDLRDEDVYLKPAVTKEDETLNRRAAALNSFVNHSITYDCGEDSMTLDGSTINEWLSVVGIDTVKVNESAVRQFVADAAEKYNTYGLPHEFKTASGAKVTIEPAYFGWELDQEAEFTQLMEDLTSGTDVRRQPVWSHEAKSFGTTDIGDTYVEVNLSAQHMYFFKNGEMILDSPVVTGCVRKGTTTPAGVYTVYAMETTRYLVGENYRSFVNYWMPFNGGIGFHDATWRGSFGGGIYVSSGSHGCVNLPLSTAKELYSHMEIGMPVMVYRLDSTATVSESSLAATCVGLINSANPVTLASESAIVQARDIYNYLSAEARAQVTNIDLLAAEEAELANQKAQAQAAQNAAAQAAQEAAAAQAAAEAAAAQAAAEAAAAAAAAQAAGQI